MTLEQLQNLRDELSALNAELCDEYKRASALADHTINSTHADLSLRMRNWQFISSAMDVVHARIQALRPA